MTSSQMSYDDAERLLLEHGQRFLDNEASFEHARITGLGIAERDEKMQFVVAVEVEGDDARDATRKHFEGREIAGFPVYLQMRRGAQLVEVVAQRSATDIAPPARVPGENRSTVVVAAGLLVLTIAVVVSVL